MIFARLLLLSLLVVRSSGNLAYNLIDIPQHNGITNRYVSVKGIFSPKLQERLNNIPISYVGLGCTNDWNDLSSKIAIVHRGNCTFSEKTFAAQQQGAKAIIIINNADNLFQMDGEGLKNIKIPAMLIKKTVGDLMLKQIPLKISVFEYHRPHFEISAGILLLIAVAVVAGSAYWASHEERKIFMSGNRDHRTPIIEEGVVELDEKSAVLGLCFASLGLLLLFYFRSKLIYAIFIIFIIGGVQGLLACSLGLCETLCPLSITRSEMTIPCLEKVPTLGVILFFPCSALSLWWYFARNQSYSWILQDMMGISLLFLIQKTVRLPNIKVSSILLVLAFIYDIFWVFISPYIFTSSVMVTVATGGGTGEQIPMLLRLPRFGDDFPEVYSLLGFGDIALPGMLISYLLRFDYMNRSSQSLSSTKSNWFSSYFFISLIGYFVGFIFTELALILMSGRGQPALLYLVPCTLGVVVIVAYQKGDLSKMWSSSMDYERLRDANYD